MAASRGSGPDGLGERSLGRPGLQLHPPDDPGPGLEELVRWHTALQQPAPPPELDVEAGEQLMAAALGAQGGVAMGMWALYMLDWLPW